ncbi:hypothetical protein FQR65_LT20523 [Abscondita terminalis]|nr:hypothetical protein FQR65_LT20523 [Abscondita terminalis]
MDAWCANHKPPLRASRWAWVKEGDNFVVLSDILGDEDQLGDWTFQSKPSREGIYCVQMGFQNERYSLREISCRWLCNQAKGAQSAHSGVMEQATDARVAIFLSSTPRIHPLKSTAETRSKSDCKGGAVIRALTEETRHTIESKMTVSVKIAATDGGAKRNTLFVVSKRCSREIAVGRIYNGISQLVSLIRTEAFFCAGVSLRSYHAGRMQATLPGVRNGSISGCHLQPRCSPEVFGSAWNNTCQSGLTDERTRSSFYMSASVVDSARSEALARK